MPYICEQELYSVFARIEPMLSNQGLKAEMALVRDYMLKVSISENNSHLGRLIIDYSPKRQAYGYRRDADMSEEVFSRIMGVLGETMPPKAKTAPAQPLRAKTVELAPLKDVSGIKHHAYVDGSFIQGAVGYGAVILEDRNVVAEIYGSVVAPEAFNSRQVAGEIQAVIEVLEWCKKKGIARIAVFYDFQNIEKWATGEYRTNTPMTASFKQYIDRCGIDITWVKVESHTGVEFNDKADELAKKGALQLGQMSLLEPYSKQEPKGWIVFNASLMTKKFMEQVDWFCKAAKNNGIELAALRNDQLGAAVISGRLELLGLNQFGKPDFVLFWDKDVRLARHLEGMGMRLFNKASAISACDDKTYTHQILAGQGIPMPKTIIAPLVFPACPVDEEFFISKVEEVLAYPVIVKEAFGSFGAQVYMARDRNELLALRKKLISTPHLYQEYIASSHGRDVRLQVVGDEVVASMLRTSAADFRANISSGGSMMQFIPSREFADMAVKAARAVGADFAGVDILFGEGDEPILCEVNSNAHMKNIFDCTGVDVADRIIRYIKGKIV